MHEAKGEEFGWPPLVILALCILALAFGCQRQDMSEPRLTEISPLLDITSPVPPYPSNTPRPSASLTLSPSRTATETHTPAVSEEARMAFPLVRAQDAPTATMTSPATLTPTDTSTCTPSPSSTATPSATATGSPTTTCSFTPTQSQPATSLPTPDGVYREALVPILMYHYISEPPPEAGDLRRDLSVPPQLFEQHLRYFRDAGYHSIGLADLVLYLQTGMPLPPKPIIFTFDDGYADHYVHAFPLLQKYGFQGTFFIITGFADEGGEGYLSWDEIKAMHDAGMEIGVHGYTHTDLRGRDTDYIVWQSLGPREAIEARLGVPPHIFCYPFGSYDEQVIAVVRSAHYWAGVTTRQSLLNSSDCLFELGRVRVRGSDSAEDLANKIAYLRQIAATATPSSTPIPSPTPTATSTPKPFVPK